MLLLIFEPALPRPYSSGLDARQKILFNTRQVGHATAASIAGAVEPRACQVVVLLLHFRSALQRDGAGNSYHNPPDKGLD
jgi:hypothetical protein